MYYIVGTYKGKIEVIDSAETEDEANYLVGQYQQAHRNKSIKWVEENA